MSKQILDENTGKRITLVDMAELLHLYKGLVKDMKECRKELCNMCGHYKERYLTPCRTCKYRKDGEWKENICEP